MRVIETTAKNQYILENGDTLIFQSYDTIIAIKENKQFTLDKDKWDYSKTTAKYRNRFTGYTTAETKRLIAQGVIKLADLNA